VSKKKRNSKAESEKPFSAADAAKQVRAIERAKQGFFAPDETQYRAYTEARSSDNYISDETAFADPNVTLPSYYERYQDEKMKNIAAEIESHSAEKIHEIKQYVASEISTCKTDMLKWMVGIVAAILIGLIIFHLKSLSDLSGNLESKFQKQFIEVGAKTEGSGTDKVQTE
jgi:hypothetical protein